ncbi:UNVERIFIED_CONTAM: hypothetical protein FKN15_074494 [Acipenser sinensis]
MSSGPHGGRDRAYGDAGQCTMYLGLGLDSSTMRTYLSEDRVAAIQGHLSPVSTGIAGHFGIVPETDGSDGCSHISHSVGFTPHVPAVSVAQRVSPTSQAQQTPSADGVSYVLSRPTLVEDELSPARVVTTDSSNDTQSAPIHVPANPITPGLSRKGPVREGIWFWTLCQLLQGQPWILSVRREALFGTRNRAGSSYGSGR